MKIQTRSPLRGLPALFALGLAAAAHAQGAFYAHDTVLGSSTLVDSGNAVVGYGNFDDYITETNGTSPTVDILDGATFNFNLETYNSSVVNVLGGNIGAVFGRLLQSDSSVVNMSGGLVQFANPQFNSVLNFSGGRIESISIDDASRFNMTGGTIGGTVLVNESSSAKTVTISGGDLGAELDPSFGGSIVEFDSPGNLVMVGKDLHASLTDANFEGFYTLYTLTGHLSDGTDVTGQTVRFENGTGGTFNLAPVPEPSSLVAMGALLVGIARRRRK